MGPIFLWIQNNPILDLLILVIIPSIIQVSKINVNPWSWLGRQVGTFINGDVVKEMKEIKADITEIKEKQIEMEKERAFDKADEARQRIISAADEIRIGQRHSKEFFDQRLRDCSFYKNHCKKYTDYENDKATASITIVEETNLKCMKENSYL